MTKEQKLEQRYEWIAYMLRVKFGHSQESIDWDIKLLRERNFGSSLSSACANLITEDAIMKAFPNLPTIVTGSKAW